MDDASEVGGSVVAVVETVDGSTKSSSTRFKTLRFLPIPELEELLVCVPLPM
jgi:hypothetical protein